jgi:phage/plasmid-associated DNA primase
MTTQTVKKTCTNEKKRLDKPTLYVVGSKHGLDKGPAEKPTTSKGRNVMFATEKFEDVFPLNINPSDAGIATAYIKAMLDEPDDDGIPKTFRRSEPVAIEGSDNLDWRDAAVPYDSRKITPLVKVSGRFFGYSYSANLWEELDGEEAREIFSEGVRYLAKIASEELKRLDQKYSVRRTEGAETIIVKGFTERQNDCRGRLMRAGNNYATTRSVWGMASGQFGLYTKRTGIEFDKEDLTIGFKDCVLVLNPKTGKPTRRKHSPKHYLTKQVPVPYSPYRTKKPELAKSFRSGCADIFTKLNGTPDMAVVNYVQKLLGYALSGTRKEDVVVFFHGPCGGNGKTELTTILQGVLGGSDLTQQTGLCKGTSTDHLICGRDEMANTQYLAQLAGARIATGDEIGKHAILNDKSFKTLTNEMMVVEEKFKAPICQRFRFTPLFFVNNIPKIDLDGGIERRVVVIPVRAVFLSPGQTPKPEAATALQVGTAVRKEKIKGWAESVLATEGAEIAEWILQGYERYLKEGLDDMPPEVEAATTKLLTKSKDGTPAAFIADYFKITGDPQNSWVSKRALVEQFKMYREAEGHSARFSYNPAKVVEEAAKCLGTDPKRGRASNGRRLTAFWGVSMVKAFDRIPVTEDGGGFRTKLIETTSLLSDSGEITFATGPTLNDYKGVLKAASKR